MAIRKKFEILRMDSFLQSVEPNFYPVITTLRADNYVNYVCTLYKGIPVRACRKKK